MMPWMLIFSSGKAILMLRLWNLEAKVSKNCGEGTTNADEKGSNKNTIIFSKNGLDFNPDMLLQQVNLYYGDWIRIVRWR